MNPSILVVDDEIAFVESVQRMLRVEGYEDITGISLPTEAPPLLDQRAFDIAFLDITMPEMDGLDLLRIVKERSPETECVMITANESIPMVITGDTGVGKELMSRAVHSCPNRDSGMPPFARTPRHPRWSPRQRWNENTSSVCTRPREKTRARPPASWTQASRLSTGS